jgi:exosortase/archaeosortase family protein
MADVLPAFSGLGPQKHRHAAPRTSRRRQWHEWWADLAPRTRISIQMAMLLGAVGVAYNYSLSTLIQSAGQDTPLAYVSLVPAIALALAAIRARPLKPEPAIHDRSVDYTIGLPLIAIAVAINLLLPSRWSTMFWVYRIDLFTLPFFVAGAVTIIFGTRVMWRQKLAIAYLFLAWPYPYQSVLLRVLNAFTALTLFGVEKLLTVIHVARPVSSLDNTLFTVVHSGRAFPLSIVSACSGVNSVVGFLLVGSAFAAIVRGPLVRKVLWLLGGMVLLWVLNLARIMFIFWAGKTWGEEVAIHILHPVVGMVTFSIGVIIMVLALKPLGMHLGIVESRVESAPTKAPGTPHLPLAVPKVYLALVVALVAALILGVTNLGLRSYNLVATASGEPRLVAYIDRPTVPSGWEVRQTNSYDWAKPLFGDTSVWNRYLMSASSGSSLDANVPVVADVINTPELSTFSAYGVENCYQFHGYALADVAQVSLPGGITSQAMSYTSQQFGSWSILYWIVPVSMGSTTSYERVVLYVQNSGSGAIVPGLTHQSGVTNLSGSLDTGDQQGRALVNNRTFLVAYARQLIETQAAQGNHGTQFSAIG